MAAIYSFIDECKKNDIKPIVGMEAYVVEDNSIKTSEFKKGAASHLLLLAANNEGFTNLLRIHNQAAIEGYYYEARTDWKHLKEYGKGIIAFSACVGGEIPKLILKNDFIRAAELIKFYKTCFDEFYLEIQPGQFKEQIIVNDELVKLSKTTNTPLIVTNDVHYLNKEDYKIHDYHVKLNRKSKVTDSLIYPDTCYWLMNYEDLINSFVFTEQVTIEVVNSAVINTQKVAAKCNVNFNEDIMMPIFPVNNNSKTEEEVLYEKCFSELNNIIENISNPQVYVDRLNYELDVIKNKGFCGYFLIVQDYVNWARSNDIPVGPGRGSAAGSLVSYLLHIIQVDPIKYGLLFERFLDPHREAIPDIDIDFTSAGRDKVFNHMLEKYGENNCALVSTFHYRKAKGAIRDAARILGYPVKTGDEIAKLIPTVYYGDDGEKQMDLSIKKSLEVVPELRNYYVKYNNLIDLASSLSDLPSSMSIHAAGILVSPIPLQGVIPLIKPESKNLMATSLNLSGAEKRLVKFDFLVVAVLDLLKRLEKDTGFIFPYRDEDIFNDQEVWDIIGSVNTTGIFQIGSKIYKDRMCRLKPKNINELASCLALVRGPSISSKTDKIYMDIIEGKREVEHIHPLYDNVTASTNGILIFQEQIMQLAVAFGMDLSTGYRIVKASAKKKFDVLKSYRDDFVKLAAGKKCDNDTANRIFDMIVKSGEYSFNKSHAVSYGFLTYSTAYYKVHYPLIFFCDLLTEAYINKKDNEYYSILKDCRRQKIEFLPATLKESKQEFTIEDNKIRIGLCAIKGMGDKAIEVLSKTVYNNVDTLEEFYVLLVENSDARVFNKKCIAVSIYSGLFDCFLDNDNNETRSEMFKRYLKLKGEKSLPESVSFGGKDFKINVNENSNKFLEKCFFSENFIY